MGLCVFQTTDMLRLVLHAINAPEHEMGYESTETPRPGLLFVHDHGVYLMSNGCPRDVAGAQDGKHVVYAAGCNPNVDAFDDWYDTSRDLVGGDDFVEVLPFNNPQEFMDNCLAFREFCVETSDTAIEAFFRRQKPAMSTT